MKLPPQIKGEERASINERLHLFAKDEKGYPFLSTGSCADMTEKGTLFLSILLSLKKIGKGVKFHIVARDLPGGKRILIIKMRAQHITFSKAIKAITVRF